MSYRFTDQNAVIFGLLGATPAANGTVQFYDQGTTTPKATYSDQDLTIPNANPVELDASGRPETEIWLDGPYTVVCRDEDSSVVWTRDAVPAVNPTTTLPDPTTLPGGTVQSNGTGYELVDVTGLPDPTDSSNQYPVTVNGAYVLVDIPEEPEVPDPEIVINDNVPYSVRVGVSDDTTKVLEQFGSGTVPAAGSRTSSVTVNPPVNLDKVLSVIITPRTPVIGAFGIGATFSTSGYTIGAAMSAFTVEINSADDGGDSGYTIDEDWDFDWVVKGTVTVT